MAERGVEWPIQDPEVKERVRLSNRKKYGVDWVTQSDNFKKKTGEFFYVNFGVDGASQVKHIRDKQMRKYLYDGLLFDSSPELCIYIWLQDHGVGFVYQPDVSFSYEFNGEQHKYFPDFLVDGTFYEVKGD